MKHFSIFLFILLCHYVASKEQSSLYQRLSEATAPMHIAAFSIPAYGHFMPVKGVAEPLLQRGHRVTLFVETLSWCDTALQNKQGNALQYNCVEMPKSHTFGKELFEGLSGMEELGLTFEATFQEMFRHHHEQLGHYLAAFERVHKANKVDVILMDLSTLLGFAVSAKFGIPHVCVFPLTMHMTIGPATYLPVIGTGFPRNMSLAQRTVNNLLKVYVSYMGHGILETLNEGRRAHDIPLIRAPAEIAGLRGLIFAPTIWGYDIAQPLCPNIVALGAFSPSVEHTPMEAALASFLDRCGGQGAVYVNFGTLAVVGNATFWRVFEAMERLSFCVVWKVVEEDRRAAMVPRMGDASRYFVTKRFNNPIAIMRHPTLRVFLTHCGDTSVLEAIQADLPLAGIPFFADQGDVCQRLTEAGIGEHVGHKHHFTVERLASVLASVGYTEHASYKERIRKIHAISDSLGGSARAADMIEAYHDAGLLTYETILTSCPLSSAPAWQRQLWDIDLFWTILCMCFWYWLFSYACAPSRWMRSSRREKKSQLGIASTGSTQNN